jgi:methylenetetrahydrofolate/methylenetetrahydromethanopterin dehydrogenase (NADP+)
MSDKRKILVQLDSDPHPSVFDRVAAIDAGADELFSYGGVTPDDVQNIVYGAIFTRGPKDLKHTAIFIGGSNVELGEKMLATAKESFFGPLRVSLMLDANGANTTAVAAVIAASKHHPLSGAKALVLGASGPVGQRVALLLAREAAEVHVASRQLERAKAVCNSITAVVPQAKVVPVATASAEQFAAAMSQIQIVIASGAPGVQLLPLGAYDNSPTLMVAVDLNAVPPLGIEGVDSTDGGIDRDGVKCYGAVGVGGTKMKIHKTCIVHLFEQNDLVLDAVEIYEIGKRLVGQG